MDRMSIMRAVRQTAHPTSVDLDEFEGHSRASTGGGNKTIGITMWVASDPKASSAIHFGEDVQRDLGPVLHTGYVMFLTNKKLPSILIVRSTDPADKRAYPLRRNTKHRRAARGTLHSTVPQSVVQALGGLKPGRIAFSNASWFREDDYIVIDCSG